MPICIYICIYICGERPHVVFSKSRINPLNKKRSWHRAEVSAASLGNPNGKCQCPGRAMRNTNMEKHHGVTVVISTILAGRKMVEHWIMAPWHHGIMAAFSYWSWLSWLTKKRGIHWSHHLSENDQMGIAQELGTSAHTKIYNWSPTDLHPPKKWG